MAWYLDSRNADSMTTTRRLRVFSEDAMFTDFYVMPIRSSSSADASFLGNRRDSEAVDYGLLSTWYKECSINHEICQKHQSNGSYPFKHPIRLIDVDAMHLVNVDMTVFPARYVALSYLRGGLQRFFLRMSNAHTLFTNIPEEALPKTIRDAIAIIRELGIRYLWVDALCIIQDSREDQRDQIASMSQIYRQAALSICMGPERLLSTRCAIFTADGIIWQCPTTTWREDVDSALSRSVWTLDSVGSPVEALQGLPLRSYVHCVNVYSGRFLTYHSDKLIAFEGLSQVLCRGLSSKPGHGLPLWYFDWALLWEPESAGEKIALSKVKNLGLRRTPAGKAMAMDPRDPYERSIEAAGCKYKCRLANRDQEDVAPFDLYPPSKGFLLFQTFTGWFKLSRKSYSQQKNVGSGLHRFGFTDRLGDWCGTVILDSEWFNSVGGIFEFAAISDAKEFSFEELDTWNYYIPEERQQAEWYCFYALMLSRPQDGNGVAAERVGLAKIYQSSFFNRSYKPCSWKSIFLG
ncbi:heterokaryon incompatibility protein [Fusarium austroafricanum]|uniref:Heterokaryon incompatibility protein n=1 Tax=Fusarium austroafricanum TaxID=2364996 RepID=A0A8H4KFY6_9HYPO|nr:heterokaryon incompatibility protein [Fusarium austroafricanum]